MKGWSVFWRKDKRCFVLSYATPTGPKQKLVPRKITKAPDARRWAAAWLTEKRIRPDAVIEQRREKGALTKDLAEKWFTHRMRLVKLGEIAPSTYKDNVGHITKHVLPYKPDPDDVTAPTWGDTPLVAVDKAFAREWVLRSRESATSVSSVRNRYYSARSFYADAMANGWISATGNPFDDKGVANMLPTSKSDRARNDATIFPMQVAQRLIESPAVPLDRRIRRFLAFTAAMRDGEIAGRTWGDLKLDDEVPHVMITDALRMRALEGSRKVPDDGRHRKGKTKTEAGVRSVPIHPELALALREWRRSHEYALRVGHEGTDSDPIFPGERKLWVRPPSAKLLRDDLLAIAKADAKAGAPAEWTDLLKALAVGAVFHETRHTLNTWLAALGVEKIVRQRFLGHAGKDVTDEDYTGSLLARAADAIGMLPLVWRLEPAPPTKVTTWPPRRSNSRKPSQSTEQSHSADSDGENTDPDANGSLATNTVQRLAKPSYAGSNPVLASENSPVPVTQVTPDGRVTHSDPPPGGGEEPPRRASVGARGGDFRPLPPDAQTLVAGLIFESALHVTIGEPGYDRDEALRPLAKAARLLIDGADDARRAGGAS